MRKGQPNDQRWIGNNTRGTTNNVDTDSGITKNRPDVLHLSALLYLQVLPTTCIKPLRFLLIFSTFMKKYSNS